MKTKMSFDFFEGGYYSPSNVGYEVQRYLRTAAGTDKNIRLHLHIAGPSGRGKSSLAAKLGAFIASISEELGIDRHVSTLSTDAWGKQEGQKWIVDSKRLIDDLLLHLDHAGESPVVLITEGTCDNESELISEISTLEWIDQTVCLVVEPDVHTWIRINKAKAKEMKSKNKRPEWIPYWEKNASASIVDGISMINEGTRDSLRFWSKFPFPRVVLTNYNAIEIEDGWSAEEFNLITPLNIP